MLEAFDRVPRREIVKLDVTCDIHFVSAALPLEHADHSRRENVGQKNLESEYPDESTLHGTYGALQSRLPGSFV
jgi:hypothetical protein